ncbi:jg2601 [Pararge aegeria aegeria]|uniref:Jg2601 protein n=1 Tax=Pararge aegeria aegeria TaxID=348720 RepID=A0A8S4S1Q5_9NEOP|nr:jg2601 [Pararge aegeria aegeria]
MGAAFAAGAGRRLRDVTAAARPSEAERRDVTTPPRACARPLSLAARYATCEPIQIPAEGSVGLDADRDRPIPALNNK